MFPHPALITRKKIAMNYKELNGKSIREGFNQFHAANPHIFEQFELQAFKAIAKGRTKISAKLIINWIRWNEFLRSSDQNFKINDAYQSYYARAFAEKYPFYAYCFEFRKLRNEEPGPYMVVEDTGELEFL
jgi:hypothetical protein